MDVDICPPWWPNLIWYLIHHPKHGPGPDPGPLDELFKVIAISQLAGQLADEGLGKQIQSLTAPRLEAVQKFG
jgi:hypothetical protein